MQNIKEMDSLYHEILRTEAAYENCKIDEEQCYREKLKDLKEKGKSLGMSFDFGYLWINIPENSEFKYTLC